MLHIKHFIVWFKIKSSICVHVELYIFYLIEETYPPLNIGYHFNINISFEKKNCLKSRQTHPALGNFFLTPYEAEDGLCCHSTERNAPVCLVVLSFTENVTLF